MTFIQVLVLGMVEGLTEFLPVSSTGHLVLVARLMGLAQTEFMKTFEIAIQSGAILAVLVMYAPRFWNKPAVWGKIILAFIPTGVVGVFLYPVIKGTLLSSEQITLWALFAGGVFLIAFERFHKESPEACGDISMLTWRQCVFIGLAQSLAIVPGVSRAAATIIGGLCLGVKRRTIVEFSFLLAVPTILAATLLDLFKSTPSLQSGQIGLMAIGALASFVVAVVAIRTFVAYIQDHNFMLFGVYRIALSLAFWFC